MNLQTIKYKKYKEIIPSKGMHILAQHNQDNIVVYQAFSKQIREYAVQHQQLGGPAFSFNRMTWIKPNFLWMMYRCGWATKEKQDGVLAITIAKRFFDEILVQAVYSAFNDQIYTSRAEWQTQMNDSEVRLQWDPDHDPLGNKQERRAIQLGMKGNIMQQFAQKEIITIEDITPFVTEQYAILKSGNVDEILVPYEQLYHPADKLVIIKLRLD